jgi:hypothetical protein
LVVVSTLHVEDLHVTSLQLLLMCQHVLTAEVQ